MPSPILAKLRAIDSHLIDPEVGACIFEELPDAVVVVDKDGAIQLFNRAAEYIFGYDRREVFDRPVHMLLPERFVAAHVEHIKGFFNDPRMRPMGLRGMALFGRHKDGIEFPVDINLSPIVVPQGTFALAVIRKGRDER